MMGDKNEIRRSFRRSKAGEELEKPFPRNRIKSDTRFIENQNSVASNQGSADQHALPFSLRKKCPRPLAEICTLHLSQNPARFIQQRSSRRVPQIQLRVPSARHDVNCPLPIFDPVTNPGTDQTDFLSKLAPVRLPVLTVEHLNRSFRGCHITGNATQQGCFARSIRSENDPIFLFFNDPVNPLKNFRSTSGHAEIMDRNNGHSTNVLPRVTRLGSGVQMNLQFRASACLNTRIYFGRAISTAPNVRRWLVTYWVSRRRKPRWFSRFTSSTRATLDASATL